MDNLSRVMKMEYKKQQARTHLLSANDADALLKYVDIRVQAEGCNHTHRFTQEWLDAHVDFMKHDAILEELENMGGYCDCEVVLNCYEDYDL